MTTASGGGQGAVWIHQVSRRHSQAPFKKIKGSVQIVLFHPVKPHFFVAVCDTVLSPSLVFFELVIVTDATLCSVIQFGRAEALKNAQPWHSVDIVDGRSPVR
jgi:hypothetical protein